jgi:hypothetical protein
MRKFFWFTCFVFLVAVSAKAQNDSVIFSAPGGFYEDVLQLELYNIKPQNHIRYTTNGNRPTAQSPLYEEALQLDMAECLTGCVQGVALYTTGIKHVDRILWPLYHKIQRELAKGVNN